MAGLDCLPYLVTGGAGAHAMYSLLLSEYDRRFYNRFRKSFRFSVSVFRFRFFGFGFGSSVSVLRFSPLRYNRLGLGRQSIWYPGALNATPFRSSVPWPVTDTISGHNVLQIRQYVSSMRTVATGTTTRLYDQILVRSILDFRSTDQRSSYPDSSQRVFGRLSPTRQRRRLREDAQLI
jgi:hypothetical protein